MFISRRDALTGASAAVITMAAITAPLAAKAALAGDPVLPAYEAFEAARLEGIAASDYRLAIAEAVKADLPPEPHPGRCFPDLSDAELKEAAQWRGVCNRRITARLGMGEDDFMDIYYDRTMLAYEAVVDIQATTLAGLLCQLRAWWNVYECYPEVPKDDPEESPWEPQSVVQRVYHDLERLAEAARS